MVVSTALRDSPLISPFRAGKRRKIHLFDLDGLQRRVSTRREIGQLAIARAVLAFAGVSISVAAVMRDLQVHSPS